MGNKSMVKLYVLLWFYVFLSYGNLLPLVDIDMRVYGSDIYKNSAKSMAVGYDYGLFLQDGKAYGFSTYARFSEGERRYQPMKYMDGAKAVTAGEDHYFILKEDGSLYSFGSNEFGQLGNGSTENTMVPRLIMQDVLDVAAGSKFSLVVKKDYTLWAFGLNDRGQLGTNNTLNQLKPVKVMDDVLRISCGTEHSLALTTKGYLYGFGDNSLAQLGLPDRSPKLSPVKLMESIEFLSAGTSHSLALSFNGDLYSMGTNFFGEGLLSTLGLNPSPSLVKGGVAEMEASYGGSLVLDTTGRLSYHGLQEVLDIDKKIEQPGEFLMDREPGVQHIGKFSYEGFLHLDGDGGYGLVHRNKTAKEAYSAYALGDIVNLYGFSINIPTLRKPQYVHEKPSTSKSRMKKKLEELRLYYERYYKPRVLKPLAITFDDGPSAYTAELLEVLKANEAKATFFVLGSQASAYGHLLQKMDEYGFEVGSHSYSHRDYTSLSTDQVLQDLRLTDSAIVSGMGRPPHLFRPPYGAYNTETIAVLRSEGKALVMWNVDTKDWAYRDAQYVKNYILHHAGEGSIILLHDIHRTSVDGFIAALPELKAMGYSLVTVSELLEMKGRSMEAGTVIFSAR